MKKLLLSGFLAGLFILSGCQNNRSIEVDTPLGEGHEVEGSARVFTPMGAAYAGQMIVKMNESTVDGLTVEKFGDVQMQSVPSPMAKALNKIGAKEIYRLFPPAGKYEERSRKEGMHLWFVIEFDESINIPSAMSTMGAVEGVEIVEACPEIQMFGVDESNPADLLATPLVAFERSNNMPYNDPRLPEQWHYNNTGKVNGGVKGADINLFKAWEVTTGTPNVVVTVVDGGIDVTHPDLVDNLWINELELNGKAGVDDDGNGYIDDIYGYCFVNNTGDLLPDGDAHGTHVSGTVAARTNNNIGVAGIAGGNGTKGTGVRVQSAAIFRKGAQGGNSTAALKYGADNGAVISQNSWGYPYKSGVFTLPISLKTGIDYFIKYAGVDENGEQLPNSPMKGGVVIFAAGNDNVEYTSQPSAYEAVIAVASMGPDFKKASYSTYGEWVDITAPGGDQARFGTRAGVLSTLAPAIVNASYGFYHGTSMACPHVSGVAALILSKKGGPGYTNEDLKKQLLAAVNDLDIDEINPEYAGKMGVGYLDAYAAVTLEDRGIAPKEPVINVEKSSDTDFIAITLFWNVPADEDDGAARRYKLYLGTEELTTSNYETKGKLLGAINGFVNGAGKKAGEEMSYKVRGLEPSTEYYFAIVAYDRWGHASKPVFFSTKTKKNTPPAITNVPEQPIAVLDVLGATQYELKVVDIDNHKWTYTIGGETKGVTHQKTADGIKVSIRSVLDEGEYKFTVKLSDELKGTEEYEIPFRIIKVKTPELREQIPSILIGVKNEPITLNLPDYFVAQEYLTFSYTAVSSDGSISSGNVNDAGVLTIKGFKPGKTMITVEVSNGHKSTRTSFEVIVVEDNTSDVFSVWPLPITNELNIWVNPSHKSAKVILMSMSGERVLDQQVTPDATGIAKINTKKVAPGSYTLRVEAGKKPYVKSVLKR